MAPNRCGVGTGTGWKPVLRGRRGDPCAGWQPAPTCGARTQRGAARAPRAGVAGKRRQDAESAAGIEW